MEGDCKHGQVPRLCRGPADTELVSVAESKEHRVLSEREKERPVYIALFTTFVGWEPNTFDGAMGEYREVDVGLWVWNLLTERVTGA
jgi:hypothetical protein